MFYEGFCCNATFWRQKLRWKANCIIARLKGWVLNHNEYQFRIPLPTIVNFDTSVTRIIKRDTDVRKRNLVLVMFSFQHLTQCSKYCLYFHKINITYFFKAFYVYICTNKWWILGIYNKLIVSGLEKNSINIYFHVFQEVKSSL